MQPGKRWRRVLVSPDMVLMLIFGGGRWWTDDIPGDAKVVDADYDADRGAFTLTLESPSFSLEAPDKVPILDVVMHTGSREPTAGENYCVRVTL